MNAWIIYWVGSALLILVAWRIARGWVAWVKFPLLLILCALFFVPFNIHADAKEMAPAWLIMMFEGVFVPSIGFGRVGPTLGIASAAAVLLFPVLAGIVIVVKRAFGIAPKQDDSEASKAPATEA
ncbi:hypothetical protein [Halioxenophilus aromaticivorans]